MKDLFVYLHLCIKHSLLQNLHIWSCAPRTSNVTYFCCSQAQFEFALTAVAEEVNAILQALAKWKKFYFNTLGILINLITCERAMWIFKFSWQIVMLMEFIYIIFMKMVKYFIFQIMFCLPPKEKYWFGMVILSDLGAKRWCTCLTSTAFVETTKFIAENFRLVTRDSCDCNVIYATQLWLAWHFSTNVTGKKSLALLLGLTILVLFVLQDGFFKRFGCR